MHGDGDVSNLCDAKFHVIIFGAFLMLGSENNAASRKKNQADQKKSKLRIKMIPRVSDPQHV